MEDDWASSRRITVQSGRLASTTSTRQMIASQAGPHREITGWSLELRCRDDEAIACVDAAVLARGF
jgi:hypothetical protein